MIDSFRYMSAKAKEFAIAKWNQEGEKDGRNLWTLYNSLTFTLTHEVESSSPKMVLDRTRQIERAARNWFREAA